MTGPAEKKVLTTLSLIAKLKAHDPIPRRITLALEATPIPHAVEIAQAYDYEGVGFLYVDIAPDDPYGAFKRLPAGVTFQGRTYGKSGFDSDKNMAYYRTDHPVAVALPKRKR